MDWLKEADVVVAEVTTPSLGVGYEIAKAEEFGKKILCLFHETGERKLSAMIAGNEKMNVKKYKTLEDAKKFIKNFLFKHPKSQKSFNPISLRRASGDTVNPSSNN